MEGMREGGRKNICIKTNTEEWRRKRCRMDRVRK